ncbi:hypothetical protein F5887DRAFT_993191 [Amanita rubescens]|nr:hypothetical protein F5887DRAFT_993191 [Amanita rubescens]
MRLSVPVSVIVLLVASMPAFAAPTDSSNTASQAYPQLEQRSPLFGVYGFIAKELFRGGEAIYEYAKNRKSHHYRRDLLEPRDERVQLLQLRSEVVNYKRALDHLLELNKRDLAAAAAYDD